MKKYLIVIASVLALGNAHAATPEKSTKKAPDATVTQPAATTQKNTGQEGSILRRENYRLPMEEVIVIGQTPYWRKEGAPRWDRSKVDVDTKPATDARLKVFPTYTAEERDDAMKVKDRNNATPKIKLFDIKF